MHISQERRDRFEEETRNCAFNIWMRARVNNEDGSLNLDKMYELAKSYGILTEYRDLNPGQQRMNIGNKLRLVVPLADVTREDMINIKNVVVAEEKA